MTVQAAQDRIATAERTAFDSPMSLQDMRKAHIQRALGACGHDVDKAARLLAVSAPNLRRWMTKLGIR